jgi:hypothetical protein
MTVRIATVTDDEIGIRQTLKRFEDKPSVTAPEDPGRRSGGSRHDGFSSSRINADRVARAEKRRPEEARHPHRAKHKESSPERSNAALAADQRKDPELKSDRHRCDPAEQLMIIIGERAGGRQIKSDDAHHGY